MRAAPLCVKSAASAPVPAAAATVKVLVALDGWLNDAVTVVDPPFSEIDDAPSDSVAVGSASSSRIVIGTSPASVAPSPPLTVAEMVTVLSGESTVLPFAVTVTAPVLALAPAAMVSVALALKVKSAVVAGDTGVAVTVNVVVTETLRLKTAVTAVAPPVSEMTALPTARVTLGGDCAWPAPANASASAAMKRWTLPMPLRVELLFRARGGTLCTLPSKDLNAHGLRLTHNPT